MWHDPVFTRTEVDVINADNNRNSPTENIGSFNHWFLNRVADNLRHIIEKYKDLRFPVDEPTSKDVWEITDFPTETEITKVRDDVEALRARGKIFPETPTTPDLPLAHYAKMNDIEKILFDLWEYVKDIILMSWGELFNKHSNWQDVYNSYDTWEDVFYNNER